MHLVQSSKTALTDDSRCPECEQSGIITICTSKKSITKILAFLESQGDSYSIQIPEPKPDIGPASHHISISVNGLSCETDYPLLI